MKHIHLGEKKKEHNQKGAFGKPHRIIYDHGAFDKKIHKKDK